MIGVVPMNTTHIDFRAVTNLGLNYSAFLLPSALGSWVFGANMRFKLFVALQLKVPQHFIERFSNGRLRGFEDPGAFRAT
jgi:hypothetical protein